jgi:hypothetical protein
MDASNNVFGQNLQIKVAGVVYNLHDYIELLNSVQIICKIKQFKRFLRLNYPCRFFFSFCWKCGMLKSPLYSIGLKEWILYGSEINTGKGTC